MSITIKSPATTTQPTRLSGPGSTPVYCNEAFRKRAESATPKTATETFFELCAPNLDCVCGTTVDDNHSAWSDDTGILHTNKMDAQQPAQRFGEFAGNAGRAFSNFASSSLQNLTTRRYTLPDKSVASQVLMYRQLLHTKCRPGLKLSREYQGTPAQKAVLHMPVRLWN